MKFIISSTSLGNFNLLISQVMIKESDRVCKKCCEGGEWAETTTRGWNGGPL